MYYAPICINFTNGTSPSVFPPVGRKIIEVAAGDSSHSLALDSNGNIWSWGNNTVG